MNSEKSPAGDWETDAAAIWFALRLRVPATVARVLSALASLGRAFQ
jgi:hypothetical protein